jgi:hypothetical protein
MHKLKNFYIKPDSVAQTSLSEESIFSETPVSNVPFKIENWTDTFKKNHAQTFQEEVNSQGFRSEEFKKTHEGLHVLFLGCSYTWGTGLFLDEVWSKKTYNKIKEVRDVSGFFNLAVPGDSIYSSIANAFKYFKTFGNPDVIFFNVQDITRFYAYSKEDRNFYRSNISDNKVLELLAYQYYYMLEQYCFSNNILLISFTWYLGHDVHILENFKTFSNTKINNVLDFVNDQKNNKSESLIARDGKHLGSAYHDYWSFHAYKTYLDNYVGINVSELEENC